MKNKEVYLLLSNVKTNVGRLIVMRGKMKFGDRYEGVKYSHVSISLDNSFEKMQSFSRKKMHNPFNAGLVKESIKEGHYDRNKEEGQIAVLKLKISERNYNIIKEIIEDDWDNKKKFNYNYLGMIRMLVFGIGLKRKNKYFCSEYVSHVLIKADLIHPEFRKSHNMRPFDIYDYFKNEIVYEGKIKEYVV